METVELREYNGHELAAVFHDAGSKKVVVFCHGYRGSMIGPSRLFVTAARRLAEKGVSSLRFDQYGSGNSEGDFYDSSFDDWVATVEAVARSYITQGYKAALFGQSMGGAAVIAVAARIPELVGTVAWVPDPNIETDTGLEGEFVEESGQRVRTAYWREAHNAKVAEKLRDIKAPMYIVQCSEDQYVSVENQTAIIANSRRGYHRVEMYAGLPHSGWSYDEAEVILGKSIDFLIRQFEALPDVPAGD